MSRLMPFWSAIWPFAIAILVAAVVACVSITARNAGELRSLPRLGARAVQEAPPLPQPRDNFMTTMSEAAAVAYNAKVPFSRDPIEPAPPFGEAGSRAAKAAALNCLATAVYYEAAGEGEAGERAVAQVVLNRVRHPAFPSSICGVVYQGSDRSSGCQFTFTCDGRLAKQPTEPGWTQAQRVAENALSGKVDAAVGMATHYHAAFVVPYWAGELSKIAAVGNHVFYRWPGYWGRRAAFRQLYTGDATPDQQFASAEVPEPGPTNLGYQLNAASGPLLTEAAVHTRTGQSPSVPLPAVPLRADEKKSTLKIDEARFELIRGSPAR